MHVLADSELLQVKDEWMNDCIRYYIWPLFVCHSFHAPYVAFFLVYFSIHYLTVFKPSQCLEGLM